MNLTDNELERATVRIVEFGTTAAGFKDAMGKLQAAANDAATRLQQLSYITDPIAVDKLTPYEYKGATYYVTRRRVLAKHPVTREWYHCVEYYSEEGGPNTIFVRDANEFYQRFKPIK